MPSLANLALEVLLQAKLLCRKLLIYLNFLSLLLLQLRGHTNKWSLVALYNNVLGMFYKRWINVILLHNYNKEKHALKCSLLVRAHIIPTSVVRKC